MPVIQRSSGSCLYVNDTAGSKGVERPTIGSYMPNESGITTLFDVGASVDSKPEHLVGYGLMSSLYVKEIYGISNPTMHARFEHR